MTETAQMLTVRVPLAVRERGRRKLVVTPEIGGVAVQTGVDVTLVMALARAFRYQRMLKEGRYASVSEMRWAKSWSRAASVACCG